MGKGREENGGVGKEAKRREVVVSIIDVKNVFYVFYFKIKNALFNVFFIL